MVFLDSLLLNANLIGTVGLYALVGFIFSFLPNGSLVSRALLSLRWMAESLLQLLSMRSTPATAAILSLHPPTCRLFYPSKISSHSRALKPGSHIQTRHPKLLLFFMTRYNESLE